MSRSCSFFRFPPVTLSISFRAAALALFVAALAVAPASSALNRDGVLLLSFKYSILSDPLSALAGWSYDDETPCAWNGVTCMGFPDQPSPNSTSRVISLVLPGAKLLGSVAFDVGLIEHLRHIDLSDNLLNGTLPASLFNASELRTLSLANNELSGEVPEITSTNFNILNLSDNALTGRVPVVANASIVSLSNNYLSGILPTGGFGAVRVLDLSSNLLNGSVPADLVGSGSTSLQYLNLSSNRLSGEIPSELGRAMPAGAVADFSNNNFSGGIPNAPAFLSQKAGAFAGNADLCGKPLKNMCTIPSTLSNPPNVTDPPESPPAFAAIPKSTAAADDEGGGSSADESGGFKPATIAAIVIGDLGGIGLLVVAFLYAYHVKRRNQGKGLVGAKAAASDSKAHGGGLPCCLRKKDNDGLEGRTDSTSSSSECEEEEEEEGANARGKQGATLVTVDGDTGLEMETLLKASAYILGAAGPTIVYKAVLADGTALAVRRIGDCGAVEKLRDLETQVRSIAKLRHPNVLRIWGFYWGPDEKLLIHDYAPNGSLANISFSKRMGSSSPCNLSWEARLKIARGAARGLAYIHEKKAVHGNVKPSNILLGSDMEAKIGDFGLDRLLSANRPGGSARLFGSKRSMHSQASVPEASPAGPPCAGPYQAPESLKSLKPSAKWDVYAFGVVLLELMSGRIFSEEELGQWNAGFVVEERGRVVRMANPALRGEVEGKEEALLSCFKLGFACAAAAPQRRPTMKDVVALLDRISEASTSLV